MLGSPRIVAIDDQEEHLAGLADCLNQSGAACLRVHFTGYPAAIPACPDVRIIFADLHLGPGTPSDHKADFAALGGLIEGAIKPVGPYFIVLWTQYPDQAEALLGFLHERMGQGVTKPFDVLPLPKSRHMDPDGTIRDDKLMDAINDIVRGLPQVGALFDWEGRVLGAVGQTVSSILELTSGEGDGGRTKQVGRVLGRLAVAAVGKRHVDEDRFRAVNEALLPILADRIARMSSGTINEGIWPEALNLPPDKEKPPIEESSRLNRLVHVADPGGTPAIARGAVVPLPDSYRRAGFCDHFGISELNAATKRFRCKKFDPCSSRFRWVLVQCQAACDSALSNPGSVPYYLGLDFPQEHRSSKNPPESTWRGPMFEFNGEFRQLRVNAAFPLALPSSETRDVAPLYRLREQVLNDLLYHVHSHGARPGMMSFGRR